MIKIIIGLGNPEKKYGNTYHNAGFLFIDHAQRHHSLLTISEEILKSEEYMNKSGVFVAKVLKKHGVKPSELLIVHDDSDLEVGSYKFSFGRGAAGHHGIESIQQSLKTNDFWRLRIGIRPKNEMVRIKAEEFVLKKLTAGDKKILENVFEEAVLKISEITGA